MWKKRARARSRTWPGNCSSGADRRIGFFSIHFLPVINAVFAMWDPQMGDIRLLAPSTNRRRTSIA
jgi:hypothetical protein